MSQIDKLLENYLKKNDLDGFEKRLEKCEKKSKKAKDMAKKHDKKFKKLKPRLSEM